MNKREEQLDKLRELGDWPLNYMFKFIIPNRDEIQDQVKKLFSENAEFSYKLSKEYKYLSVTVTSFIQSPERVLEIYQKASEIKGLYSL
ncbi:MAG: DUF493 domain-containing protein [Marinifilaceae bacterium]|jgi:putative lipoic acid-binding regulatory protein|nr:DUF493 domain-containing protein [Marinifilaceae bacterium]